MIKNQLKKFEKSEKGVHVARTEWDKTKKLVQNIISTTKQYIDVTMWALKQTLISLSFRLSYCNIERQRYGWRYIQKSRK